MSTVLWTAFAVAVFVGNVAAHEAGHAVALRRLGGDITAAGLGIPIFPCLRLRPTERRTWTLTLSPWLLMAYVRPNAESEAMIAARPYRDRAWFAAVGIIVNGVLGGLLLIVAGIVDQRWGLAGFGAALAVGLFVLRRAAAAYLVPLVGVAATVILVLSLATTAPSQAQGIVGTGELLVTSTASDALLVSAAIALGLALVNCLPIFPFDGGRVVSAAVESWCGGRIAERYEIVTGILAFALVVYTIGTDVWSVIA